MRHSMAIVAALLAAGSVARADQSVPEAKPSAKSGRAQRKVIRLDDLDRCMGRLARPVVTTAIPLASTGYVAVALRSGLELEDRLQRGDLEQAAKAFERAAVSEIHPLREAALFELGRARFRLDDNDGAAAAFARVLDVREGVLHDEALRYLALVLGDTCAGGSLARARAFVGGTGAKPWQIDLWRALAGVFFDTGEYAAAIEANRAVLALAPLGRSAPDAQVAIIRCLQRERDVARAATEQEKLAAYRVGGDWYEAHKQDRSALAAARAAVEDATRPESFADVEAPCNDESIARLLNAKRTALAECLARGREALRGSPAHVRFAITIARDGSITVASGADPVVGCIAGALRLSRAPTPDEQCRSQATIIGGRWNEVIQ